MAFLDGLLKRRRCCPRISGIVKKLSLKRKTNLHLPLDRDLRVIFMLRRLDEVISSQGRMMKRLGQKPTAPETLQSVYQSQVERTLACLQKTRIALLKLDFRDLIQNPHDHARQIVSFVKSGMPEAVASVISPDLYREKALDLADPSD